MYRRVFPSVNKTLADRRANIEGKLEQAERERNQAQELLEQCWRRLRGAQDETQRIPAGCSGARPLHEAGPGLPPSSRSPRNLTLPGLCYSSITTSSPTRVTRSSLTALPEAITDPEEKS
jgi:hypothetical protein